MKEENYWQKFTNSGRIEDYLSYAAGKQQTDNPKSRHREDEGDNPYAGFYCGDGNGIESNAYR